MSLNAFSVFFLYVSKHSIDSNLVYNFSCSGISLGIIRWESFKMSYMNMCIIWF